MSRRALWIQFVCFFILMCAPTVWFKLQPKPPPPEPPPECVQHIWMDEKPSKGLLEVGNLMFCAKYKDIWERNDDLEHSSSGIGYDVWEVYFQMSVPPTEEELDRCTKIEME